VRKIQLLPNLLTLANAICGLLAICKGIDALAYAGPDPLRFYQNLETAAWLIYVGMVFDALDGKVARMVGGGSAFGAQLDSFSDMLTFGVAPAIVTKILIEHEAAAWGMVVNPRLTFAAAALFATMAILRLARFNLENDPDPEAHKSFRGLPSPAAAGTVASALLLYLTLRDPRLEHSDGIRTPLGLVLDYLPEKMDLGFALPTLWISLVVLGLLMVSRVRYTHMFSALTGRGQFFTLVWVVVAALLLLTIPALALFVVFHGYVLIGLARAVLRRGGQDAAKPEAGA
jgi:CDP-diacylglycerol--serine O-phosphatidyltransferase